MNTLKKKILEKIALKLVNRIAVQIGNSTISGRCFLFIYEVEIPKELVEIKE